MCPFSKHSLAQTTVAVAGGAGRIGTLITEQLVLQGAKTVVLSRSPDTKVAAGATLRVINYDDASSIMHALSGIEVVVSALSGGGKMAQPALAIGAKKAGVKLFLPSEFGIPSDNLPEDSPLYGKTKFHHQLKNLDLPYLPVYAGFFSDVVFTPMTGVDIGNKKVTIVGDGDKKMSFTTRADVAHFIAYVVTHIPASQLANKSLRVEGDKKTYKELIPIFEEVYGGKFELEHRDVEKMKERIKENPQSFGDYILLAPALGMLDVGKNDNALVPDFKPLKVKAALTKYFPASV